MGNEYQNFYWQNGYGAFSVSPSKVDVVSKYIENQHDITKKKHFRMNTEGF